MAADVCGYSRLVALDEERTLADLHAHRAELIDPKIAEYGGRIANTAGDSLLIEFPSVVEALRFAIAMQQGIAERNKDIPDESRVVFRIGINLGDVMERDGDLLGDGVNVAARIEALAEPGGINVSAAVVDQIGEKVDAGFEDLGETKLKNFPKPVHIYRVRLDGTSSAAPVRNDRTSRAAVLLAVLVVMAMLGVGVWWAKPWGEAERTGTKAPVAEVTRETDRPVVAVLPFDNMSKDEDQEYFSDGMTDDLVTDLSKVSGLLVVARTLTFAYKGKSPDVREVGKALNARYVIEGSVRKSDGRVRINAQLIDAETGNHVWADRYDRDFNDVFTLQDEVIGKIVSALKISLTPNEQRQLARHETDNAVAYDFYLRGLREETFFTKDGNQESRRLFEQAINLDPSFALAYARLAQAYSLAQENGWLPDKEAAVRKALELAEKAIKLDSESPQAHWSLARVVTRPPIRDPERAVVALSRAVELDPNYADGHAFLANVLIYVGRAEEALGIIETAIRINPRYPFWYVHVKGQSLFVLGRYEEAIPNFQIAIERNPAVGWPHRFLLAAYGQLGLMDDAEWEMSELESLGQLPTIKEVQANSPIVYPEYLNRYLNGLRKAGVPEE